MPVLKYVKKSKKITEKSKYNKRFFKIIIDNIKIYVKIII